MISRDALARGTGHHRSLLIDQPVVSCHERTFRVRRHLADATGECVRRQTVIGVEEDDICADALGETGVASRRQPTVPLVQATHTRVATGDGLRVVWRSIVNDDDLEMGIGLGEHALDGIAQEMRLPIARDDDRDNGRIVSVGDSHTDTYLASIRVACTSCHTSRLGAP